jgi:hypothetical protein
VVMRWVHTSRDTLHTATTSETSDSGLCDALNVVTKNLAVTLRAALAETLATFAACEEILVRCVDDEIGCGVVERG